MSKAGIETFLRDVTAKRSFAAQVGSDASILNGYDLTMEEKRALRRRDHDALRGIGVAPELLGALDALGLPDETSDGTTARLRTGGAG